MTTADLRIVAGSKSLPQHQEWAGAYYLKSLSPKRSYCLGQCPTGAGLSSYLSTVPLYHPQCAPTRSVSPLSPRWVRPSRCHVVGACRHPSAGGPVLAQTGRRAGWCPGLRWRGRERGLGVYDAVDEFGVGHLKIPATRFGSGGGLSDRPAAHNLSTV